MRDPDQASCLHELVEVAAARHPDRLALAGPDGECTFREMDRRADRLADLLVASGVRADDLVGLAMRRSAGAIVAMLGIMKAGGAFVYLDPALPRDRLSFMATDARLAAVVTDGRASLSTLDSPTVDITSLDDHEAPPRGPVAVTDGHAAYVMYTSGSEGEPKGVVVEHRSVLNLVGWQVRELGITADDRAAEVSNFSFDASVLEIWPYLIAGGSVHVASDAIRPFPHALRRWIAEERLTAAYLTSPLAEQLMELGMPDGGHFRLLVTGGDRLHTRPQAGCPVTVVNVYGPTEATVITTAGPVEPAGEADGLPTIGRPVDNVRLHLLDEAGQPVADGQPGEVFIAGPGVARGYLRREGATRERFLPDPFGAEPGDRMYRTGDIACRLPDGRYSFAGRRDGQVKVRGYRIELGEVEAVLATGPAVAQAVVLTQGSRLDSTLVAYVQPAGAGFDEARTRRYLAEKLPYYMVPSAFHVVEKIPLTSNGKIDRAALAAHDLGGGA